MTWTAKVNGEDSGIIAKSLGELLRLLKSASIISKYWYGEKIKRPIPMWVSKDIVDLYEDGVAIHDK